MAPALHHRHRRRRHLDRGCDSHGLPSHAWPALLLFIAFAVLADRWRVSLSDHGEVSLCFITCFAAAAVSAVLRGSDGRRCEPARRPLRRSSQGHRQSGLQSGQLALVGGLTGLTFQSLAAGNSGSLSANALAYACSALVFVAANSVLTGVVLALLGRPFLRVWARILRNAGVFYLAVAPVRRPPGQRLPPESLGGPVFPLLAWVIYRCFGLYAKLRTETQNALVALANSLERRDPYTFQHSARVAEFSRHVATQMRMPEEQLDLVVSAAQVHDLGIDRQPHPLQRGAPHRTGSAARSTGTPQPAPSWARVGRLPGRRRDHPLSPRAVGRDRLSPDSLTGQAIPLGARIIAVADVYDAMTSDRPYRDALPGTRSPSPSWSAVAAPSLTLESSTSSWTLG